MKQEVSDFKAGLLDMYRDHLAKITEMPDYDEEIEVSEETSVDDDATRIVETPVGEADSAK